MTGRFTLEAAPTWSTLPVGGKADGLIRLTNAGMRVPPFVVLRADAAGEAAQDLAQQVLISLESDSRPEQRFAVRSSADVEDGVSGSYAGMFESYLGVGAEDLGEAIAAVVKSTESARVAEYQSARNVDRSLPPVMNVLVQAMVDAETSGVAFSRRSADSDTVVIEAVFGLGEYLVSGRVEPDSYFCSRPDFIPIKSDAGFQARQLVLDGGRPSDAAVPTVDRRALKLSSAEVIETASLAVRVEELFEWTASDIEWARDQSGIWLLQARPYAAISN